MTNATRNASPLPKSRPRPHTPHRDPGRLNTARAAPVPLDASPDRRERRLFPGWRWVPVALAFPIAGYIGWKVGGRVDAVGAALVGYDTDLSSLALMGLVSGAVLGAAQGLVLVRAGGLELPWAVAMPVLFALGWSVASATGIGVDDQFTVFGAGGALLFMLGSGLLLARFTPSSTRVT